MVEPFISETPDAVIDDLHRRIDQFRQANSVYTDWRQGTPGADLTTVLDHWRHRYDWRKHEAELNSIPQIVATIDGQRIHALHLRSNRAGSLPLLLIHGWPGSVWEFVEAARILADPTDEQPAFDLVIPSLPGFGRSEPVTSPGWHPRRIARTFVELMDRLGARAYGVQGGDWGSLIAQHVADLAPEQVVGVHLNFFFRPRIPRFTDLNAAEADSLRSLRLWQRDDGAYHAVQSTKPSSLGAALDDSPAGLAAWILEKLHAWSGDGGHLCGALTIDQIVTNLMWYWVTRTATSSARLYWETAHAGGDGEFAEVGGLESVPFGMTHFPAEIVSFPRSWVERFVRVTSWRTAARGGHFAAWEQPELFAAEVAHFFSTEGARNHYP